MAVDRASPVPLYFQVAQQLERLIDAGDLPAGARLENEVALADQLGVSRPTMRAAIQYLVDRGLLVRRRGVGTQVVHPRVRRPAELTSLFDDLDKSGQRPHTQVLSFALELASERVANALDVQPGTEVYAIRRLRFTGEEPLAIMTNYLPVGNLQITAEALADRGLYDLMRSGGVVPKIASQTIGAKAASAAEARTLHESRGAPLLTMQRTAYDGSGRAVEHGSHVYRPSLYTFTLTLASS